MSMNPGAGVSLSPAPPRLGLRWLLLVVVVIGLGLATVRTGSRWGAAGLATLTWLALFAAVVGAAVGRNRAYWLGFAAFGWGYWLVALGPWFRDESQPNLLTNVLIVESYRYVHPERVAPPTSYLLPPDAGGSMVFVTSGTGGPERQAPYVDMGPWQVVPRHLGGSLWVLSTPEFLAYERTLHALSTLLLGSLGGVLGSAFAHRCAADKEEPA